MILLLHATPTLLMTGLIWFVQIVHYPLLARASELLDHGGFARLHEQHVRTTTWIVAPIMLVEMVAAVWLVLDTPQGIEPWQAWAGLGLLAACWGSTFFWQVPLHARLVESCDRAVAQRLVTSNWLRTAAWTLRSYIALAMIGAP